MLFCDHCDRGYHTFCVNLEAPPTGLWICPKFCSGIFFEPKPLKDEYAGEEEDL